MRSGIATMFLALGLLAPMPASAYTLVLKAGARVDVGDAYRLDGSRVAYRSAAGEVRYVDLAQVDLQATARENGETIASFVDRASRAPRAAAPAAHATAPRAAVNEAAVTVTTADLEPYRVERERLDAEYYARHPQPPAYFPSEAPASVAAPDATAYAESEWREQARVLREQLDVEQDQLDALHQEIDIRQNNPFKYRLSYQYNFGNTPILQRRGQFVSLYNPVYPSLRADDEFAQINSRLIDLEIQHRATLTQWDAFVERARRAGVPPGVLRE